MRRFKVEQTYFAGHVSRWTKEENLTLMEVVVGYDSTFIGTGLDQLMDRLAELDVGGSEHFCNPNLPDETCLLITRTE